MAPTKTHIPSPKYYLTLVAAMLSMIGPFSIDAYLPSFPAIEAEFNINRALLSQSMTVYLVAFAISTLAWGPISDRIGRRVVILIGLVIYITASIACAYSNDINSFLLYRTLQGFAASGGFIASRAMIRDAHDTKNAHKAMSQVIMLFAIAPAIAPILGAWLQDLFGWRSVFIFLTLFAALLFIMTSLLKETLEKTQQQSLHPKAVIKTYNRIISHRQFMGLVFTISCSFSGVFLYIAGAPSVIYDFLALTGNDFSLLFIPIVIGLITGAYASGRLAHHWTKIRIIKVGFIFMSIAVLFNIAQVTLLEINVFNVVAPLVIYVVGLSLIMPAVTIMCLDYFPKNRGSAASMQSFFQMLVSAAVAGIAIPLLQDSIQHFVYGQAFFLIMALMLWTISKQESNTTHPLLE